MTFNENKEYREFRSETLRELQALQKQWRKQDFKYTPEQQERYDNLLAFRREQVTNSMKMVTFGLVLAPQVSPWMKTKLMRKICDT